MRRWQSALVASDLERAANGVIKAQEEPLLADLYIEDCLKAVRPALNKPQQALIDEVLSVRKQRRTSSI